MKQYTRKQRMAVLLPLAVLALYFSVICLINFSLNPGFYVTDMYSDVMFGVELREHKSLFPEGWVFGNQLYVAATPVLSGILNGIVENPFLAMAYASVLMTAFVMASFLWMVKPALQTWSRMLTAAVVFMTAMLVFGDACRQLNGWQLLFTMCSYYACYAVTAFLAFGWYIRGGRNRNKAIPVLCCLLSLATGIQSIRQTAIMVMPLAAMEALRFAHCRVRKETWAKEPLFAAAAVSCANLLGVIIGKLLPIQQNDILGRIVPVTLSGFMQEITGCLGNILGLMLTGNRAGLVALPAVFAVCCAGLVVLLGGKGKEQPSAAGELALLLGFGVAVIAGIDVVTTMQVRSIYYFLLFPLMGYLAGCVFLADSFRLRKAAAGLLVFLVCFSCALRLPGVCIQALNSQQDPVHAVSEYLLEQGYTTIYSGWNLGEKVAVASGGRIQCGFWDTNDTPFEPVTYLCDPSVFDGEPESSAYLFRSEEAAEYAVLRAREMGAELTLLRAFPESGLYIYTASEKLMTQQLPVK